MYNLDLNHRVVCYKIVFHWHDLFYMDYHQYLPFVQRFYAAFGHQRHIVLSIRTNDQIGPIDNF